MADSTTVEEEEENEFLIQQYNVISLSRHEQECSMGLRFERYFSHQERYFERHFSSRDSSSISHPSHK